MFNFEIRKYTECSNDEKRGLPPVIDCLVELAVTARDGGGVHVLEKRMPEINDDFLKLGIGLLLDGTDTNVVQDILDTAVIFSYKTGVELLKQLIIREGVLGISRGYNPMIIKTHLWKYLGEDFER